MINMKNFRLTLGALAVVLVCLLYAQSVQAASHSITFGNLTTTSDATFPGDASPTFSGASDYSASGLNLGTAGYWFFNFDAAANTGSAPEANEVEALPSWITVDKTSADPEVRTLADGSVIHTSTGGQSTWSSLTLPESSGPLTGVSGAVIAAGATSGDSKNVFEDMYLTSDTPASFLLHIVVDNTNGEFNVFKRMKVRGRTDAGATEINMRINNLQDLDGSPDVYSFRFDNWGDGDELRLQVRSDMGFSGASISGIMFDVIPEPTSALLMLLGGIGMLGRRRR